MKHALGGTLAALVLLAGLSWSAAAWSYALTSLKVWSGDDMSHS